MGAYIDPPNQTKEAWLRDNAVHLGGVWEAKKYLDETTKPDSDLMLVCWVNNGPFTAAGIVFNRREFEAFSEPNDHRPKSWWLAEVSDLLKVSTLKHYLPGSP